jgi:hypothetical protein
LEQKKTPKTLNHIFLLTDITDLLNDAVEAERARIEGLIPKKEIEQCDFMPLDYEEQLHAEGFNEAIEIMQEAVKGK